MQGRAEKPPSFVLFVGRSWNEKLKTPAGRRSALFDPLARSQAGENSSVKKLFIRLRTRGRKKKKREGREAFMIAGGFFSLFSQLGKLNNSHFPNFQVEENGSSTFLPPFKGAHKLNSSDDMGGKIVYFTMIRRLLAKDYSLCFPCLRWILLCFLSHQKFLGQSFKR